MKFEIVKTVTKLAGRTGLKIQKCSPEILMAAGIAGIIVSTVMACRATKELDEVMEEHEDTLDEIKDGAINDFEEKEYKKELAKAYCTTGLKIVKLYGPAVTLQMASIGCILGSHGIMKKRNVALMAAYKAIEASFDEYRKRVIEEFGEEKDYDLKHGIKPVEITDMSEDGSVTKKTVRSADPNKISQYAKFFDASSDAWQGVPEYDLLFLKGKQNMMNNLLQSRGHVFLNEVYDCLGLEHTKAGSVVGWILTKDGDNFIDFGIFDGDNPRTRAFVNGTEDCILLDFNVDGVIYDLIEEEDGFRSRR